MFKYEVMSYEEAMQERFNLLKEGEYDAVVAASEDTVSKSSGNPMMVLTLDVFDENGKVHSIKDYLVFTKAMMWKVVHFADSAGLLDVYEEQKLCSKIAVGSRVRVKIGMEDGGLIPEDKLKGKILGSKYPSKNKVEEYVKQDEQKPLAKNSSGYEPFIDDDIAF